MSQLTNKTALITGGTTGLGRAMAEHFLNEGASVVITGRDAGLGREAEQALRRRGHAAFIQADAGEPEHVTRSVDEAVAFLGGLDILVNNAGVGVAASVLQTPPADFDRVMDINVRGYFLYAQAAYPHLARRRGNMIHIASDAGIVGEQSIAVYSISKAAVIMLAKMLALDGAPDGVRSNCICPGNTLPGMRHFGPPGGGGDEREPTEWPSAPIGRVGNPEDIAAAALYFASEQSAFCTGSVLLLDGGIQAGVPTNR